MNNIGVFPPLFPPVPRTQADKLFGPQHAQLPSRSCPPPRFKSPNLPWKKSPRVKQALLYCRLPWLGGCRVVLRLPGETGDGLAGQESNKVGQGGGGGGGGENGGQTSRPTPCWRSRLSIIGLSGRILTVKGLWRLSYQH